MTFNQNFFKGLSLLFLILWLYAMCWIIKVKPLIQSMNGQTFGIPTGWHLVFNEDTGETMIERD